MSDDSQERWAADAGRRQRYAEIAEENRRLRADAARLLAVTKRARGVIGCTFENTFGKLKADLDAAITASEAGPDRGYVPTTGPLLDPDDYIPTA